LILRIYCAIFQFFVPVEHMSAFCFWVRALESTLDLEVCNKVGVSLSGGHVICIEVHVAKD